MALFAATPQDEEAGRGAVPAPSDAKDFFVWAQRQVAEALMQCAPEAAEYDDIESYLEHVFKRIWPVVDAVAKASFRNGRGIRRSRRR